MTWSAASWPSDSLSLVLIDFSVASQPLFEAIADAVFRFLFELKPGRMVSLASPSNY